MIAVIRPRISGSCAPTAVYGCPSACAGTATPGQTYANNTGLRNGAKQRDSTDRNPFRYPDVAIGEPNGVMRVHKFARNELIARSATE